jgi:hypothetical protein
VWKHLLGKDGFYKFSRRFFRIVIPILFKAVFFEVRPAPKNAASYENGITDDDILAEINQLNVS